MRLHRRGLPEGEAERLAAIMAAVCTERGRGWSEAELAALASQPGVAVAAEDDGFGVVRTAAGEAEILTLAVVPAARGRGLGRALLDALTAAAAADGAARLVLEVAESNAAARRLYAAAGFAVIGRRRGYVHRADGTREDALVLAAGLG
ncbi:MAG TPA: GNAT family N-acetyltransferase [Thermohalobaculum sp.]|nr:GNAT family N-acetyltransferase [Thermohalobaculum sp.]